MDLTRDVIYRGFKLNDSAIRENIVPGSGLGSGISGCILDSWDISDVDVVQFTEKRSQGDGLDAGDVFLGARRLRLAGTLFAPTRALLYDAQFDLAAALNPVLAQREEPADKGYRPLYFSVPTNRNEDYPAGAIDLRVLAMPRARQVIFQRDAQGGEDGSGLALPWQATLIMRDPSIQGEEPQDYEFTDTVIHTGTAEIDNIITDASHGLAALDRIYFTTLTGGTGLSLNTAYYVSPDDLTTDGFKVRTTVGGSNVDITGAYSTANWTRVVTTTHTLVNRGNYLAPLNMLFATNLRAGTISVSVAGSIFTITVPASTGNRIVRYDGGKRVLTIQDDGEEEALAMDKIVFSSDTTHPLIPNGETELEVTFIGLVLDPGSTDGSHAWFWEAYAG